MFKVGDYVKVKEDLVVSKRYNKTCLFNSGMICCKGKTGRIIDYIDSSSVDNIRYQLDIPESAGWMFSHDMLEFASSEDLSSYKALLSAKGSDFDIDTNEPLFRVGDKVVPCECPDKSRDSRNWYSDGMKRYIGQTCTVSAVVKNHYIPTGPKQDGCYYALEGIGGYSWSSTMLKRADEVEPVYKVGDKVLVKENLVPKEYYGSESFETEMLPYCGKQAVIADVVHRLGCYTEYNIDLDGKTWNWTSEMFVDNNPKQKLNKNENQLQREDSAVVRKGECTGRAVCYPRSKTTIGIGHIGDTAKACMC